MVKVTHINNLYRKEYIVNPAESVRSFLDDNQIEYVAKSVLLNGQAITSGNIDNSFEEFNVGDNCFITVVTKADNA